ncbi:MAG: hypothetical protein JWQ63_1524 [Mucilaginibacter sp.]|jgi:hypothetical protein|nr:hypothetical protein [Mucilaginibacter sp.]
MEIKNIKKQSIKAIGLIMLACLTFVSCKKQSTGSGKLTYSLQAINTGAVTIASTSMKSLDAVSTPASPTNITWNSGFVYVSDVEFKATNDTTHIKYESEALKKIDLFSPSVSLFNDVILPSGIYNKIKLEVRIGNTSSLNEPGIYLKGMYGTTPIAFAYDENKDGFEFEVEGHNYTFDHTKDYSGLITLHLNLLLNGLTNADFDAATQTNGVILINSTTNINIYQQVKQNLEILSDVNFENKTKN